MNLDNIIYDMEIFAFPWKDEKSKSQKEKDKEMEYILFKNSVIQKYDLTNNNSDEKETMYKFELIYYLKDEVDFEWFKNYMSRL